MTDPIIENMLNPIERKRIIKWAIISAVVSASVLYLLFFIVPHNIEMYGEERYQEGVNDTMIALFSQLEQTGEVIISQDYKLVLMENTQNK